MSTSLVDIINKEIDDLRGLVQARDKAIALEKNPEFKELILDGFCRDRAAEYVQQSVSRAISVEDREHALALSQASGYFLDFLNAIVAMGNQAEDNIERLQQELHETLTAEE